MLVCGVKNLMKIKGLMVGGILTILILTSISSAQPANFQAMPDQGFVADLIGADEVPPVNTAATGQAVFTLSPDGTTLHFKVTVSNIANVTASHIHLAPAGVNGPVVVTLFPGPKKAGHFTGVLAEGDITSADLAGALTGLPLGRLIEDMNTGNTYVNVHTDDGMAPPNTGAGDMASGEIRGQIRSTTMMTTSAKPAGASQGGPVAGAPEMTAQPMMTPPAAMPKAGLPGYEIASAVVALSVLYILRRMGG